MVTDRILYQQLEKSEIGYLYDITFCSFSRDRRENFQLSSIFPPGHYLADGFGGGY